MSDTVQDYLELPRSYCQHLGGLRWARADGAIEYEDGRTFAFSETIALFVEGFSAHHQLIHFGHLVHLFDLLLRDENEHRSGREFDRVRKAFLDTGASYRNAGALALALCPEALVPPRPVDPLLVCEHLRNPMDHVSWVRSWYPRVYRPVEWPPIEPGVFEEQVCAALRRYSDDELRAWLRHGRGSVKRAGEELAQTLPPPRALGGVVAMLLGRERLAGAEPFVVQLIGALSLPPRRLAPEQFPVGGYADVTTRGRPDHVLPSQFALDELEFVRRLAEKELLYSRREEPPVREREDLVVLLDQGVRTWGDVRLVLAGAALALARLAGRHGTPFLLATTSGHGEPIDPRTVEEDAVGEMVEASDLSTHPGLALERVLEEPAPGARDVVLLTHPRNLREADVSAAARRVGPRVRLFALTVDADGNAELCEMRHGAVVRLRTFRIDIPGGARRASRARVESAPGAPWKGQVEPIGFPFRFGVGQPIDQELFDFDYHGEWLLTVSRHGMLYAWRADGEGMEILPRAMVRGCVLTDIRAVLGVAGGFVLVGFVGGVTVVVHYAFPGRTCIVHSLVGCEDDRRWRRYYSPEHHSVVLAAPTWEKGCAIDLASGGRYWRHAQGSAPRASEAWRAAEAGRLVERALLIWNHPEMSDNALSSQVVLKRTIGELSIDRIGVEWRPFVPLADGQIVLKECRLKQAQSRGSVLAIKVQDGNSGKTTLRLYRAPDGVALAEFPTKPEFGFVLSRDGRKLAQQIGPCQVAIHNVFQPAAPPVRTRVGGFSSVCRFLLGDQWLFLSTGKRYTTLLGWKGKALQVKPSTKLALGEEFDTAKFGARATKQLPRFADYDPQRFLLAAARNLVVVADRFGQVALFDRESKLICMLFAFRSQLAAWMPDGTRYGPASLTGGPPTPDALEKIGLALRQAEEQGVTAP